MPDFIKLPSERVEQLRQLSENLNMSIADCIAVFIREQIEKGNLEDRVPGITVERKGNSVTVDTGAFRTSLTADLAKRYAAQVRAMVRPISTPAKGNPFIPELDVARRGTSIKLIDRATGAAKTLAPSVAEDFVRVLEQSASK
ncbi:hypothetical protein [Mesorhizobium sp. RMAD-H1]|uniref:hypothetical protein n=1 Tax=Mesorhizobium sp. RMAD-H1 TaxID=2587065 RepID=UPI00160B2114|nr:hypothetical protein [Mesorhizobium sp. RMAD-H1]MBB2969807.1 hypothetical protein [Mesorhizobium sp. RMAD-H1]